MPRVGLWTDRTAVYVGQVPDDFAPASPWAFPIGLSEVSLYVRNLTLADARAMVRAMNKRSMESREADPESWDRTWAIAVANVRSKGADEFARVPSGIDWEGFKAKKKQERGGKGVVS